MGILLIIVGLIMMGVSAFWEPSFRRGPDRSSSFSLWRLGLTLFFAGWVLFGRSGLGELTD